MAGEQRLAVAVHHEERVVDTHAKADHGRQRRRERGDVEEARDDEHEHLTHDEAEEGHDDGHAGGDQGAEGDQQDHDGDDDADGLARRGLGRGELQHLTARSHLQGVGIGRLDRGHDRTGVSGRDLGAVAGEAHARERDGAVSADGRRGLGGRLERRRELLGQEVREVATATARGGAVAAEGLAVGVAHARDGVERGDVLQHRSDRGLHRGVGRRAGGGRPHDAHGSLAALVGGKGRQHRRRRRRLSVGQGEGVVELAAEASADADDGHHRDEPRHESPDRLADGPPRKGTHANLLWRR